MMWKTKKLCKFQIACCIHAGRIYVELFRFGQFKQTFFNIIVFFLPGTYWIEYLILFTRNKVQEVQILESQSPPVFNSLFEQLTTITIQCRTSETFDLYSFIFFYWPWYSSAIYFLTATITQCTLCVGIYFKCSP